MRKTVDVSLILTGEYLDPSWGNLGLKIYQSLLKNIGSLFFVCGCLGVGYSPEDGYRQTSR